MQTGNQNQILKGGEAMKILARAVIESYGKAGSKVQIVFGYPGGAVPETCMMPCAEINSYHVTQP